MATFRVLHPLHIKLKSRTLKKSMIYFGLEGGKMHKRTERFPKDAKKKTKKHPLGNFVGMNQIKRFVGHNLAGDALAAGVQPNSQTDRRRCLQRVAAQ